MLRGGICAAVSENRAAGHFLAEMCILHSRTTVGTALSSAKCASRRQRVPAAAAARPATPLRGTLGGDRGGASCPNLLQRPRSRRSARRESLIFRASAQRRSRRETPLQQIWTRPRPGPPQEPHQYHPMPAHPRHHADPGPWTTVPGEKGAISVRAAMDLSRRERCRGDGESRRGRASAEIAT